MHILKDLRLDLKMASQHQMDPVTGKFRYSPSEISSVENIRMSVFSPEELVRRSLFLSLLSFQEEVHNDVTVSDSDSNQQ